MKDKITTEMISDVLRALPNEWTSVREMPLSDILLIEGNIDKNSMSSVIEVLTSGEFLETAGSRGGLRYRRFPASVKRTTAEAIEILTLKINELVMSPKKTVKPTQVATKIKSERPVYIDDEVFFMYDNRITTGKVFSIHKSPSSNKILLYDIELPKDSAEDCVTDVRHVFRSLDEMLRVMKELFLASKRKKN